MCGNNRDALLVAHKGSDVETIEGRLVAWVVAVGGLRCSKVYERRQWGDTENNRRTLGVA